MKLSEWARQHGLSYKTAWRLWRAGQLPVSAFQLETGTVVVQEEPVLARKAVLYACVSSSDQKDDLTRQLDRLRAYALQQRLEILNEVTETGSSLHGKRPNLLKWLRNPAAAIIVVEHRERLVQFGFDYIEAALQAQGRSLIVIDESEPTDGVERDLHEVIISLCARLYGRRSARHRADKAMEALHG